MKQRLFILAFAQFGLSSLASAAIYLAQTTAGAGSGSSCADAHAASWFNTASNWGTGSSQIGPGQTVFLCGSINTNLTFQGSGTSGNYITLDGTGATYTGTIASGTPSAEHSWWKVQNIRYADGNGGKSPMEIFGGSNGVFTKNHVAQI